MFYLVFYENEKVAWKTETGIGEREQGLKYHMYSESWVNSGRSLHLSESQILNQWTDAVS